MNIIYYLFSICLFWGCVKPKPNKKKEATISEQSLSNNYHDENMSTNTNERGFELRLYSKEYELSVETIPIKIINHNLEMESNSVALTDDDYSIFFLNRGKWEKIILNFDIESVAHRLLPRSEIGDIINLYPQQHCYLPGKYRVYKTITIRKSNGLEREDIEIYSEFILTPKD